jgi:hypothetical protein
MSQLHSVLSALLLTAALSNAAHATVDYIDRLTIVYEDWNEEQPYHTMKVPFIGCAGIPYYATLQAFTQPYNAPSTGCGSQPSTENLNLLSCAKITGEENDTFSGFKSLAVDLSACNPAMTSDMNFRFVVSKAIKLNFPELKKDFEQVVKFTYPASP